MFRLAVYRGLLGREMVDAWLGWHAASTRPLNHSQSRRLTHQSASYLHQPRTRGGAAMGAKCRRPARSMLYGRLAHVRRRTPFQVK